MQLVCHDLVRPSHLLTRDMSVGSSSSSSSDNSRNSPIKVAKIHDSGIKSSTSSMGIGAGMGIRACLRCCHLTGSSSQVLWSWSSGLGMQLSHGCGAVQA